MIRRNYSRVKFSFFTRYKLFFLLNVNIHHVILNLFGLLYSRKNVSISLKASRNIVVRETVV